MEAISTKIFLTFSILIFFICSWLFRAAEGCLQRPTNPRDELEAQRLLLKDLILSAVRQARDIDGINFI
jgi:hypothetical protein